MFRQHEPVEVDFKELDISYKFQSPYADEEDDSDSEDDDSDDSYGSEGDTE